MATDASWNWLLKKTIASDAPCVKKKAYKNIIINHYEHCGPMSLCLSIAVFL
jgi:hypothetical protein